MMCFYDKLKMTRPFYSSFFVLNSKQFSNESLKEAIVFFEKK